MNEDQLGKIKDGLEAVVFSVETSKFFESYNHLVGFMSNIKVWKEQDFYVAINAVYGWMPRIIRIHPNGNNILDCLEILNQGTKEIDTKSIETLSKTIDNSLVAVSKLLHFTYPNEFAIYDSRVKNYLKSIGLPSFKEKGENYLQYCKLCKDLVSKPEIKQILSDEKFGKVSNLRKIEVFFYEEGGK